MVAMRDLDIAWLAGLFEGEGSMYIAKNGGTRLAIGMTDRDVIERVNALVPCTQIQVVHPKPVRPEYSQPKTRYNWRISDPVKVREVLELLLPWFGRRRSARAQEVLAHLDSRRGNFHGRKTHCAKGHPYDESNTYIRPNSNGHRHCRKCMVEWSRDYQRRQRSGAA